MSTNKDLDRGREAGDFPTKLQTYGDIMDGSGKIGRTEGDCNGNEEMEYDYGAIPRSIDDDDKEEGSSDDVEEEDYTNVGLVSKMSTEDIMKKVRKVILEHNHELTPVGMVHMIADHCSMANVAKSQIDRMNVHGISTSKIVGYMAGYLEGKAIANHISIVRYNLIDDRRLGNLIWADGGSGVNYQHFGDAEYLMEVPKCLVLKRWKINAKSPSEYVNNKEDDSVHFLCQALEEDYRVFDGAPTSAAGNG
ncbi:hypothetical protein AHAS_Ahas13G0341100 [Arachis hypogaea]